MAQGDDPAPLPAHCRGAGPLPLPLESPLGDDFCGCTWGMVYYRGQPVVGVGVALEFNNRQLPAVTRTQANIASYPFYVASGLDLGARRGDVLTMSVTVADQQLRYPFRAWPEATGVNRGEQQLPLVLPELGEWRPWFTGGYTATVVAQGQSVWAGGAAGLLQIDLTTNLTTVHTLPWSNAPVVALAVTPSGALWVAGPHQLAAMQSNSGKRSPCPLRLRCAPWLCSRLPMPSGLAAAMVRAPWRVTPTNGNWSAASTTRSPP
jgi:hypothetical protein